MSKGHKQALDRQKYRYIQAGLQEYRMDSYIRDIEKRKGKNKGTILPFVRGLRFSALLIYTIRQFLNKDLEASWGHLIDDEGELSRECDIIIHNKGEYMRWNGDGDNHVMDFRFIEKENAIVVISCKSFLTPSSIEKDYCTDIDNFSKKVWLFAECCGPDSAERITTESIKHGYKNFWYLYTWNKASGDVKDALEVWDDFVKQVRSL